MMARSRNIKPGFFQNEDLADLDFATRLLFIGLWTEADREGRLEDRPKRLKIALFPADDVDMEPMLAALHGKGFISRYQAEGKQIIQIVKWAKHQNPHKREGASVLPAEDGCRATADENVVEEADSGPEKPDLEVLFESFWKAYPRKTAKDTARKSFAKLSPTPDLMKQIMEAVAVHRTSAAWLKDDGQFIPHAATWLNQKRWNDEVRPSNVHQLRSRHHGFDERDYSEGLFEREDGTYGF